MSDGATINFPVGQWMPSVDQFAASAATLVAVVGAALDRLGRGEPYRRRVFIHSAADVQWQVPDSGPKGQITAQVVRVYFGETVEQQFQFAKGALGRYGKRTVDFRLQLLNEWPTPKGGIAPALPRDSQLMVQTGEIWQDGLVMISALWALAMGGITTDPPVAPIEQDYLLVGDLQPVGPEGLVAGWKVDVSIQL